ncbi:MAG TPA: flagellar export chaperone FliS [Aeromonadales bacterium]|nr:flagellar export chaperone FliS [Aeromonadales bacterium]
MISNGAAKYSNIGSQSGVENASPHRLIQMLIDGALERTHKARGYMSHGNITEKGENISSAMSIIGGLQASLNKDSGGDIAVKLDALYAYMIQKLMASNLENDVSGLDEVIKLLQEIKSGWDGIEKQVSQKQPIPA